MINDKEETSLQHKGCKWGDSIVTMALIFIVVYLLIAIIFDQIGEPIINISECIVHTTVSILKVFSKYAFYDPYRIDPLPVNEWFDKIDVHKFMIQRFIVDGPCSGTYQLKKRGYQCVSVIDRYDMHASLYLDNGNIVSDTKSLCGEIITHEAMYLENVNVMRDTQLPCGWEIGDSVVGIIPSSGEGMWLWNVNVDRDPFTVKVTSTLKIKDA